MIQLSTQPTTGLFPGVRAAGFPLGSTSDFALALADLAGVGVAVAAPPGPPGAGTVALPSVVPDRQDVAVLGTMLPGADLAAPVLPGVASVVDAPEGPPILAAPDPATVSAAPDAVRSGPDAGVPVDVPVPRRIAAARAALTTPTLAATPLATGGTPVTDAALPVRATVDAPETDPAHPPEPTPADGATPRLKTAAKAVRVSARTAPMAIKIDAAVLPGIDRVRDRAPEDAVDKDRSDADLPSNQAFGNDGGDVPLPAPVQGRPIEPDVIGTADVLAPAAVVAVAANGAAQTAPAEATAAMMVAPAGVATPARAASRAAGPVAVALPTAEPTTSLPASQARVANDQTGPEPRTVPGAKTQAPAPSIADAVPAVPAPPVAPVPGSAMAAAMPAAMAPTRVAAVAPGGQTTFIADPIVTSSDRAPTPIAPAATPAPDAVVTAAASTPAGIDVSPAVEPALPPRTAAIVARAFASLPTTERPAARRLDPAVAVMATHAGALPARPIAASVSTPPSGIMPTAPVAAPAAGSIAPPPPAAPPAAVSAFPGPAPVAPIAAPVVDAGALPTTPTAVVTAAPTAAPVADAMRRADRAEPAPIAAAHVATPPASQPPQPAAQAFAAAMFAAAEPANPRRQKGDDDLPVGALTAAVTPGAVPVSTSAVQPTTLAQQPTLDTRRDDWMASMIDHIETLRDDGGAVRETRMRLAPDALGTVEVSVHRDESGAVQVRIHADTAQARALLADATPKLTEMAEARGLKLGGASVDSQASFADHQRRDAPAAPQPALRAAPARATDDATDSDTDSRIA